MPLFRDKFDVSDELLSDLRSKFLEEVNSGPEAAAKYHPDDVKRVKENDWFIARYLLHQDMNLDKALKMLKQSLQFRHAMDINTLKKEDIPEDYFEIRTVQIYNVTKQNIPVVAIRAKAHKKHPEETRLHQQHILYWVEKAVMMNDWGALAVLFDCTDMSYKNVDLDLIKFILTIFQHHYPWTMRIFIVYNMPWYMSGKGIDQLLVVPKLQSGTGESIASAVNKILESWGVPTIWKIIKAWIPENQLSRVVFVDKDSITEHIDKDQLPVCLGGTCTDEYDSKIVEETSKGWF